jgi:hypothetical protein
LLGTGFSPAGAASAGAYVVDVLGDWRVWALEAIGVVYLVVLGRRAGLGATAARRRLVTTGTVAAPIGFATRPGRGGTGS